MLAFPHFLRRTNYRNHSNPNETAFHLGMQADQDLLKWLESHPDYSVHFNMWISNPAGNQAYLRRRSRLSQ